MIIFDLLILAITGTFLGFIIREQMVRGGHIADLCRFITKNITQYKGKNGSRYTGKNEARKER